MVFVILFVDMVHEVDCFVVLQWQYNEMHIIQYLDRTTID